MKILILSWRCIKNPAAGGSELYFHELAKRWVRDGHEVTWFSPKFPGSLRQENFEGINTVRRGGKFSVYSFAAIEKYLRGLGKDCDVIIDVENGIPFFSPLYFPRKKVVLHAHHLHLDQWSREMPFPLSRIGLFLETKLMPKVYRGSKIITISNSSAEEIKSAGFSDFLPPVVNPGIEFYRLKKSRKSANPTVLFLNRIKKYKGAEDFIAAAQFLEKKNKKIKFLVAGSGEDLDRLKGIVKEKKISNVEFLGRVSEERKKELMQSSWVFVNPSMKEGWGIVNIEANYAGTPVIGSNVGGIRDSVINGKTGILFEHGNVESLSTAINQIVSNKRLRETLSKNSRSWAKKFDWDSKANQYLDLIKGYIPAEATKK